MGKLSANPPNGSPALSDYLVSIETPGGTPADVNVTILNVLKLLVGSTALTVSSQANAGTGGGTMYYINLGGIKLLWVTTSAVTISGSGAQQSSPVGITFPTSFFTTIQSIIPGIGTVPTGTSAVQAALQAQSGTTSISVMLNQITGTNGSAGISVFVLGT